MADYKPVIGLEIHVELKTKSGMFCQCKVNQFGAEPNTHVCPVCLGLPGALPVPNKQAIEWTIKIGKALNCQIMHHSKFDRKHYSYPDLPKGYQISQYDEPIAVNGKLLISNFKFLNNSPITNHQYSKTFRIHRVHLEEDTGKLIHRGTDTLVDFNRSGTPLVEIVTEPDFNNSDDVKLFLEELHTIIRYLGVSDADMEKGSMRMEPNISLRISTTTELPNYKVEVKNINSFRFVKQAIDYELTRQRALLEKGITPKQETRGFDDKKQETYSQRSKEEAQDYRYFPEPDIPPLSFTQEYIDNIEVPELPVQKLNRYVDELKLKPDDAFKLTRDSKLCEYYEIVNLKIKSTAFAKASAGKQNLAQDIANLIINKKLSTDLTVEEFVKKASELLKPKETDINLLESTINRLIVQNKKIVDDYKGGKKNALMFLVGQVMREMKGKADATLVRQKLVSKLT